MKLKKIQIELIPSYRLDAGKYEAELEYENERGSVQLKLDPEVSAALLLCIGDVVTQFAAKSAEEIKANLTQSVLEARNPKAIEG